MADALNGVVRCLHRVAGPDGADRADGELLARYAADRDEAAFEVLVRRHGPMVRGVCRRVLRHDADADDAFQATFLVLACRAGSIRKPGLLGNWLYGVAVNVARKARAMNRRRLANELAAGARPKPEAPDREGVRAALDAELSRLPEKYRVPIVLCDLEGHTIRDAAAHLGCPPGTVATRLTRDRALLANRLTKHGFPLSAAALGAVIAGEGTAGVPPALVAATVRVCRAAGAVPAAVLALANEVTRTMFITKLTTSVLAVLIAVASVLGIGTVLAQQPIADPPQSTAPAAQPDGVKGDAKRSDFFDRKASLDRLQRIGAAVHAYCEAHDDRLPADIMGKDGKPLLSWRVALLPYLDQDYLYAQFRLDEPWDSDRNRKLVPHLPKAYRTPRAGAGETRVQGFVGPGAAFEPSKPIRLPQDFPDGTVNTVLAVEAGPAVPWTKPADLPFDPKGPLPKLDGPYPDGFAVVWADGSPRWVASPPNESWLRFSVQRDDGEVVVDSKDKLQDAKPLTEREKQELKQVREWYARIRDQYERQMREREAVLAELRKLGPVALLPEPPAGDDLDTWTQAYQRLHRIQQADISESVRLWNELVKRSPEAAERIRKELEQPKAAAGK